MKEFKKELLIITTCIIATMIVAWVRIFNFDPLSYQLRPAYIEHVECGFKNGCYFDVVFKLGNINKKLTIHKSGVNLLALEKLKGDSCVIAYHLEDESKSEMVLTQDELNKFSGKYHE